MANKKPKGIRANTRYSFKGTKLSTESLLKELKVGEKVTVVPNGRYQKGLPFRRFAGHVGIIEEKAGKTTYLINFPDMGKKQKVSIAHLKKMK